MAAALTLTAIRSGALRLPARQRARLADALLHSLPPSEEPLTGTELDRRMADYESGKDKGIPGEIVHAQARKLAGLPPRRKS